MLNQSILLTLISEKLSLNSNYASVSRSLVYLQLTKSLDEALNKASMLFR